MERTKFCNDGTPEIIKCDCGKQCHRSIRFHVYEKNFCSKECMHKFKVEEDIKREKPKKNIKYQEIRIDYGSS